MASRQEQGTTAAFLDWIQFPYDSRQSAVRFVMVHVIGMRVTRKIQHASSAVRTEVVMPFGPNCQKCALHAKAIAILARITCRHKFVHEAENNGVIGQFFEGPADG